MFMQLQEAQMARSSHGLNVSFRRAALRAAPGIWACAAMISCNRAVLSAPSIKPLPSIKLISGVASDSVTQMTTCTYFLGESFDDCEKSLKAEPDHQLLRWHSSSVRRVPHEKG